MDAPADLRTRLQRALLAAVKNRIVRVGITAFFLSNTALLITLVLTEQLRWLPAPWPLVVTHRLFEAFFVSSALSLVIFGTASIGSAFFLYHRRRTDPRADTVTLVLRALLIPATYLLSLLWSGTWLIERFPRFFGGMLVGFFVVHQIGLTVYSTWKLSRAPHGDRYRDHSSPDTAAERPHRGTRKWASQVRRFQFRLRKIPWEIQWHVYGKRTQSPIDRALSRAVFSGNVNNVGVLLKRGASPNTRQIYGVSLLTAAASDGFIEIVQMLLEAGARVDAASPLTEVTALEAAATLGRTAVVGLLLEGGAAIDTRDRAGVTPLLIAAIRGHSETVRTLLERGAAMDAATRNGITPLIAAAQRGDLETIRILLNAGADVTLRSRCGRTAQQWADNYHHEEATAVLRQAEV